MGRIGKNKAKKELSADILYFHILPRLPAKCLRRFRFDSKQWHSLYQRLKDIDCVINYPFKGVIYDCCSVVASLHGMVCFRTIKYGRRQLDSYSLILWNPVTGEYKRLSEASFPKNGHSCSGSGTLIGLYYTSSDNDYKLLLVTSRRVPDVYIYSVKSNSWGKVDYLLTEVDFQFRLPYFSYYDYWNKDTTTLLDEKLYFLGQRGHYEYLIIRFDTKTEKFTQIGTPAFPAGITVNYLRILVVSGCIHLCVNIDKNSHVELWRMDGDRDWTKVLSSFPKFSEPLVMHFMRNENWFMLSKLGSLCQVP